jgi:hypothetical protein
MAKSPKKKVVKEEPPPIPEGLKCKRGHDLTAETAFFASGLWQCKTCRSQVMKGRPQKARSEAATMAMIYKDMSYVYNTQNRPEKAKTDTPRQAHWRQVLVDDPLKFVTMIQKVEAGFDKKSGDGSMDAGTKMAVEEAEKVLEEVRGVI